MGTTITASTARAGRWQEILMLLDGWELLFDGDVPAEGWDEIMPMVRELDPSVDADADAIRAAADADFERANASAPGPDPVVDLHAADGPDDDVADDAPADVDVEEAPEVSDTVDEPADADDGETDADQARPAADTTDDDADDDADEPAVSTSNTDRASGLRWVDVAARVLTDAGRPMTAREIYDWSVEHGPTKPTSGKTPWQTIARDLRNAIAKGDGRFTRGSKRGTYVAS